MRLIDADYVTEKLNEINGTAELDKAFEVVENAPTVDVLDKIRTKIEERKEKEYLCFNDDDMDIYMTGLNDAIDIIDKYKIESEKTDADSD